MRLPKFEYFAPTTLESALNSPSGTEGKGSFVRGGNRHYGKNVCWAFEAHGHHRSDGD